MPEWIIQENRFVIAPDFQIKVNTFVNKGVGKQGELCNGVLSLQTKGIRDKSFKGVAKMCFQDLDGSVDMLIKFLYFFCRDPEFLILRSTNRMLFELVDVFIFHLELRNVTGELSIFGVPV